MNIRNAVYANANGSSVDVEIEHPEYGWIPYTFISDQVDESFDSEIREYLNTATISPFAPQPLPLSEAISAKMAEIMACCTAQDENPFEYPVGSGIYYKITKAATATIDQAGFLGLSDSDPIPVPSNGNRWDSYDGLHSTPMTVGELKEFAIYAYGIPESNYANAKRHLIIVSTLTNYEDVVNYDYSTGWK